MPARFNTTTEGVRVDLDPTVPVDAPMYEPNESSIAAEKLSRGVGSILDTLNKEADETALGAYSVEAADILDQTTGYSREMERIKHGLMSAGDQATVERYSQELARLRRGEIQGALDPLSASARINALTKKYITRNPGLALKFRQIHNGIMDDVDNVSGASSKDIDPQMEAINDIVKSAVSKGWSPEEEMNFRRAEAVGKAQTEMFAAKARRGVATEADIASTVLANAGVFYTKTISDMANASKNPNFQGMNWFAELSAAKAKILQDTNLMLQQTQQKGGFTLTREFQNQLVAQATAPLDQLISIAEKVDNPKTRAAASEALLTIAKNNDITTLRNQLGPITTLLQGTDDLWNYISDISNTAKKLQAGQGPKLEAIAKYDIKTRYLLDAIKANGWEDFAANAAKDVDAKTPIQPTGNPVYDKLSLQAGLNYAIRATISVKGLEEGLTYLAGHPDAFEAWDKRVDVVNKAKNFPTVVDALKQNSTRLLVEEMSKSDAASLQRVRFNPKNPKEPFYLIPVGEAAAPKVVDGHVVYPHGVDPVTGQPNSGSGYNFINPHAINLVGRLNQQYRVFTKMGLSNEDLMKWATSQYEGILDEGAQVPVVRNEDTGTVPSQEVIPDDDPTLIGLTPEEKIWATTPAK